ncbi:TolC family outer membrane protein [Rhizobium sp. S95]|uniref:TolC family outer membrane protein n=1 Tax=Ciceribacter sichuanensis TaxID=2949647 RepID=A0AAJ1BTQ9_9HYPH|nr:MULTISPECIES: TolC family outer membrane protein [unclassified Ciceribacter]MCM2397536.1 TolC family outer membrane protein [Ciceribacter sp. S95]MCM2399770.1 TolC family outer membrane protein [Ciceribacter sp. S153]MCO5956185.1 TolC family outer membrane protein [Ciceribacter sp. S101]
MSFIRKTALASVVLPVLLMPIAPVTASAESLYGAMAKAYENNPDLNAARAALRATDENVTIAKAGMRPQVAATATASAVNVSNISGGIPDYGYNNQTVGISITQQIFDGFQTLNNVRAAESGVFANRESLRANEISILLAAVQSYANVARDQQIVVIRKQNLAFLQEQLNAANARLQVGEGTRTDVSQAEAQLAGSQALLSAAVAEFKQSEATYLQIVGVAPSGIKQPSPASKALPPNLDAAVQIGIREHPSVLAALHAVNAAGYQVKSAEGSLLPGVVIQGNVGRNWTNEPSTGGDSPDNSVASVSAQLKIPIYQGGAEYGQIRKAKETLGEQRILVDSARAEVVQQITAAYAQMEAATAAISAARKQISAANLALQGVIEERNVGQKTTLDVLNAQQTVLEAKESLVGYQRNAVVASYAVLAASGRLTVQSQGLEVAEYRAEEHYEAVKDAWFGLRTPDGR